MDPKITHRDCFACASCSFNCPNAAIESYDQRCGYGLAEDLGYELVECKECYYNSYECKDCLFDGDKEMCPKLRK